MRTKITYICETCGYESESEEAVLACEAEHLGLTPEEKEEYDYLKRSVERCSKIVSIVCNESTRYIYDSAVTRLIAFEVAHGLNTKG